MPAAAWMTIAVAGLIIVITAVGLIRIVFHLYAIRAHARRPHRRRAGRRPAHVDRPRPADLGQRQPQARPRLLRNGVAMTTDWTIGYVIGGVIVLAVVVL